MNQTPDIQSSIDAVLERLVKRLGPNLLSCILYGSAARGDMVQRASDVNLLVVLEESTPAAHSAIASAIKGSVPFEPFVIERRGMERSMRAFAPKFLSIRRDYRLLHGEDVLATLEVDPELERFLCEQAMRNFRFRVVHAYIVWRDQPRRYANFVQHSRAPIIAQLSETLRLTGIELPHAIDDQLSTIGREMDVDLSVLKELAASRTRKRLFTADEIDNLHGRLFQVLHQAVNWMEEKWPTS